MAKRRIFLVLSAIIVTYFTNSLWTFGLNVASPRIAADLNGMSLFSWGISLPALAASFATLIFGKLSDMYGRRVMLIAAMVFFLVGTGFSALSQTFAMNVAGRFILALGQGAISPLCFSVLGDLFNPVERARWSGLLAIPAGISALISPTLTGWITDRMSWRYFFWLFVPLVLVSGTLVYLGIPARSQKMRHRIDILGALILSVASGTMVLGFSWGGSTFPWASVQVIGLLAFSVAAWGLFLRVEGVAAEPMLDPQVLTNRTFLTAAAAALTSFFGLVGIMVYYPLFLQGVQGASATMSGQMITPFSLINAFMGVPAGLLLAKTRRYKWMYVSGYALLTATLFTMVTFTDDTPIWLGVVITALAGLGLGTIPTINTLVVQYAVPRRLLGAAVGSIFFFVMMGMAIAPAILGSAMNRTYTSALNTGLPESVRQSVDAATLASLADSRILLSSQAMNSLQQSFSNLGDQRSAFFGQTVVAIRNALRASLQVVFLIGAVMMLVSFLLILTIPEISLDAEVKDKQTSET